MNTRFFTVPGSDRTYDRNIILAVLLISLMMSLLQVSSVNNLLPSIHSALNTTDSATQWILSGFTLAIGVMLVPAGRMGDLAGRSGMFVLGLGVFALASLGVGLAPNPLFLNIMRVFQGFGAGIYSPQVTGMILQYFQGKARAKAFGLMGLVVSMSVAVGPVLSGSMVALFGPDPGWRVSFFLNVPIAAIAMIASWRYLPFTHQKTRHHLDIDPFGMLQLVLAVLCIMTPFMSTASWRWYLLIGGAVLLVTWVIWEQKYELRGKEPMVSVNLFRTQSFGYCTAISGLQFLGSSSLFVVLAMFLQQGLGVSALWVGLVGLPNALASGYMAVWSGRHALDHGKSIQVFALATMVATTLLIILVAWGMMHHDWPIWIMSIALIPIGLGAGSMGAANQTQGMLDVPPSHGGAAGGVLQTVQRVSTAIGNAMITGVFFAANQEGHTADHWFQGFASSLVVVAVCVGAAALVALRYWRVSRNK
ncbi:MFS transporter [Ancrocorticia sp.]|uniref:MFS transporter n=1 Tax=Ancrocorticia sp. TaxID=2593684 RepID=UPI003F932E08